MTKNAYKIAIVSDIHSNYTALRAVFDEIDKIGADDIVVAGDILGGFVLPNETIELIRSHGVKAIHGNREDYLRHFLVGRHEDWKKYDQMKPVTWTASVLSKENLSYILNLPTNVTFNIFNTSIRVVHGSPKRVNELIYKHEDEKIAQDLANVDEDILICGHSHQQWNRCVNDTLIVNPGSAGLSFRAGCMAPFSLLTYEDGKWTVDEHQVSFSFEETKKSFQDANIPNYKAWEKMLLHSINDGKVATLAFLKFVKAYALSNEWDEKGGLIPNELWNSAVNLFDWDNIDFISRAKRPNSAHPE